MVERRCYPGTVGRLVVLYAVVAACGRIGFGAGQGEQTTSGIDAAAASDEQDARPGTDATDGGTQDGTSNVTAVAYVGPIVMRYPGMGSTDAFPLQAMKAGDAIALMVACAGSGTPTVVTLTAPGWTITALSPLTLDAPAQIAAASFWAIAPSTAAATATVTWDTNCNRGKTELADEFANADPVTPFDAHAQAPGTGNATTMVTNAHANDAVWGAVYSATMATALGSGYTAASTDGNGDFAEYALTTDPAGTAETVTFANPNGFVVVAATIAPAP